MAERTVVSKDNVAHSVVGYIIDGKVRVSIPEFTGLDIVSLEEAEKGIPQGHPQYFWYHSALDQILFWGIEQI